MLEIIINVLEHVNNMPLLLFGRFLGGISTNLLFSAFESWMARLRFQKIEFEVRVHHGLRFNPDCSFLGGLGIFFKSWKVVSRVSCAAILPFFC